MKHMYNILKELVAYFEICSHDSKPILIKQENGASLTQKGAKQFFRMLCIFVLMHSGVFAQGPLTVVPSGNCRTKLLSPELPRYIFLFRTSGFIDRSFTTDIH